MHPTRDQIERAAYDRWLRRHQAHGYDRDDWVGSEQELTYRLNYETIAEYTIHSSSHTILGPPGPCRFCEQTAPRTAFSTRRPVVQGIAGTSLFSAQICDECQEDCRDPLAEHSEEFWTEIFDGGPAQEVALGGGVDLLAVFKSLVVSALLIMPEDELGYFPDTLDWANNPDHQFDGGHFADSYFQIYHAAFLENPSWIRLARRIDDEALFPYTLLFVAWNQVILQMSVPMSVRDQDLEGRIARMPVRSLIGGEGPHFQQARTSSLRLSARRKPLPRGGSWKNAQARALALGC